MQKTESRFGRTPLVAGLFLSLFYMGMAFFAFEQKRTLINSFDLIAGVIFIVLFALPLIRGFGRSSADHFRSQKQAEVHKCNFQQSAFFERAPINGSGHTAHMVLVCWGCGTARAFPEDNYLLTTKEHRDALKEALKEKGVNNFIEPQPKKQ